MTTAFRGKRTRKTETVISLGWGSWPRPRTSRKWSWKVITVAVVAFVLTILMMYLMSVQTLTTRKSREGAKVRNRFSQYKHDNDNTPGVRYLRRSSCKKGTSCDKRDIMEVSSSEIDEACSAPAPKQELGMAGIVQVYNHEDLASEVIESLASQSNMEKIMVYNDGSVDNSKEAYEEACRSIEGAEVLEGHDVHEIRNYNKGMKAILENPDLEHVKLFALMQDDDILTEEDDWGRRASELFQRHKHLCVLGGYVGWSTLQSADYKFPVGDKEYERTLILDPEYYGKERSYNVEMEMEMIEKRCAGQPFIFVGFIASSPMILRRECVEDLGLLSEMNTNSGESGVLFDIEYSLRAWYSGRWSVGLYSNNYTHGVGGHSSWLDDKQKEQRNLIDVKNQGYVWKKYLSDHTGQVFECHYLKA